MQPPSSWPTPASPAPASRRPPPQPEFQCHHADCLRRFVRKTSLTNHLKAHQNIRSRSIYRTKRARLRAAAAMQAAANNAEALAAPSPTFPHPHPLPLPPHQHLSDHVQNQHLHPPYRTSNLPPHTLRDTSISRRTDSSPISTASGPSSPVPAPHTLSAHTRPTTATTSSAPVHDPSAPQDAPTSLVSPNSFSTHPLDAPDNPALIFTKAFDMSAVAAAPTWGINTQHPPHDNYHPAMLTGPFAHQQHPNHDNVKNEQQQHHVPNVSQTESLPIVNHVETMPNAASAATAAAASDLLPQTDLFSEQIEALHPYEFLGDFGSYS